MIECRDFLNQLDLNGIDFFTGVPDSLLKDFISYISDNAQKTKHIVAANEGNAIGIAGGYHLATGKTALVYMQNSGQGNAVNPLTSLTDTDVYGIPALLLVGWRGEPGIKDEPQHVKQGKVTLKLFDVLGIPYDIFPDSPDKAEKSVSAAINYMKEKSSPYAIVVKKGTFCSYKLKNKMKDFHELRREDAVKIIIDNLSEEDIVVSTTGKTSRELFEYREELKKGHERDFLTVGSMGHASQIALGIAISRSDRTVFCIDGDGALIMHMGALATIGSIKPENLKHIVINNGVHDSVGGQKTAGFDIDIPSIAKSCGYTNVFSADNRLKLSTVFIKFKQLKGPSLLEIKTSSGARENLGRPTKTPAENKSSFINFIKK